MVIYDRYSVPAGTNEEEARELESLKQNINLANSFDFYSDNVRAMGLAKDAEDGKLHTSTSVISQFEKDTFFELEQFSWYDNPIVLIKSVFTNPDARGNGGLARFLKEIKNFCIKKDYGLIAVCNPFRAHSFDRVFFQYIDFEYTGSKEERDKMANVLSANDFQEISCVALNEDIYSTMIRSIRDYHGLVARWFAFNCPYLEESKPIADEIIEKRMLSVKETFLKNPDQFDELGQNKHRIW